MTRMSSQNTGPLIAITASAATAARIVLANRSESAANDDREREQRLHEHDDGVDPRPQPAREREAADGEHGGVE